MTDELYFFSMCVVGVACSFGSLSSLNGITEIISRIKYGNRGIFYDITFNETMPRERSDRGRFLPLGKKAFSYRGAYRVLLFN